MRKGTKFWKTALDSTLSIIPIIIIVVILSLSGLAPLQKWDYILLFSCGFFLILGNTIFQLGTQQSLVKVGQHIGSSLSKQTNIFLIVIVSIVLGALVTCAEPSIMILSTQTPIPSWLLVLCISLGVGVFVTLGVLRVIYHKSLRIWLLAGYGLVFALILLIQNVSYIPLIFDAGGATTGSATVPFILALGAGVATVRGGKNAKDESFGLIGIASIGPLITLTILVIFSTTGLKEYTIPTYVMNDKNIWQKLVNEMLPSFNLDGTLNGYGTLIQVFLSLLPILVIFLIYQKVYIKLPKKEIERIIVGFAYAYIGLVIFLTAIQSAMMPIGNYVGKHLGNKNSNLIILIAFMIGLVTVLCEPAIHVLTKQIEDISDGGISHFSVLLTLSLGVGVAIGLCAIRAIFDFSILYYLVPGYIISIILSFMTPPLYMAMAFDSGGVASGPMTTSFVLPMIIGITISQENVNSGTIMGRAFGVIGMVAMIPIIAIQILGIVEKVKRNNEMKKFFKNPISLDDGEIIHFVQESNHA